MKISFIHLLIPTNLTINHKNVLLQKISIFNEEKLKSNKLCFALPMN